MSEIKRENIKRRGNTLWKATAFSEIFMFILSSFAFAAIVGGMVILVGAGGVRGAEFDYNLDIDAQDLVDADIDTKTVVSNPQLGEGYFQKTGSNQWRWLSSDGVDDPRWSYTATDSNVLALLGDRELSLSYPSSGSSPAAASAGTNPDAANAGSPQAGSGDSDAQLNDIRNELPPNDMPEEFPKTPAPPTLPTPAGGTTGTYIGAYQFRPVDSTTGMRSALGTGNENVRFNTRTGLIETYDSQKKVWTYSTTANNKYTTIFGDFYGATGTSRALWGNLFEGVQWAVIVWGVLNTLGNLLGDDADAETMKTLSLALGAGVIAGKAVYGIFQSRPSSNIQGSFANKWGGTISTVAGLVVAYLIFANNYERVRVKTQTITFKCYTWQAPRGGANCGRCNGNPLQPCSEYRCKALGQTCMLLNQGTGQERCINSAPNDVTSPGIKPNASALAKGFSYTDVRNRPPGGNTGRPSGMRVIYNSGNNANVNVAEGQGCIPAFTPFAFGITTTDTGDVTQPAQCKISFNHTENYNSMDHYLGDNQLYVENHEQVISMPGTDFLNTLYANANGSLEVKNDGEYKLYIRCVDGNGNENRDEFVVSFCVDKTPDLTPPLIKSTSIPSNSPVLYKVDNVSIEVYTNEPSECRWSRKDGDYTNMENQMACSNDVWEMNAELLYTCRTTLTGVKDKEENQFYFRCTDLSAAKNKMQQSYSYKLIGTQPLTILSVGPNGTIGSPTTTGIATLTVKTDNGYKNGEATCAYSLSPNEGLIDMVNSGGINTHSQPLDLLEGNYTYYFKCADAGGNVATSNTSFYVFLDKYSPVVVRTYSYETKLILFTDEESSCRFSTTSCNFDLSKNEGTLMPYDFEASKSHLADWNTKQVYYIKCKDKYNNQPSPSECSIILRPYNMPE